MTHSGRAVTSYGDAGFSAFLRGAFLAGSGLDREDISRPIIGIADTSSDFNPCHRQMPQMVESVKQGVLESGGLPMVFPTISLGETLLSPTSMIYRNLLAMETEEMMGAQPMDAVVLLGGCDKTVPAQLMAAASSEVPAICEVTGPMVTSSWHGERLGACTDCRRMWARHRAGELDGDEIEEVKEALVTTPGTCMVMGTASTMATITEALGMMLPGGATPPSASGDRLRHATATGRQAVALARSGTLAREVMTRQAFENALVLLAAVGGSTNAVVHLLAIARRAGVALTLEDVHATAARIPLLLDLKPSGSGYMEDFHHAGGVPVLMRALESELHLDTVGVTGVPLGELIGQAREGWQTTIRGLDAPLGERGALAVLRGSLAPDGAVLKVSAATAALTEHVGPAVVFDSPGDAVSRLDDPGLGITADHVLVLRNAGPVGAGMPEAGSLPIPKKLAAQGVTDMVRVSDARMSGTSYGTVVLHCSPEAVVGGPLGLVRDGDLVELSLRKREVNLLVDEAELTRRRAGQQPTPLPARGWKRLFAERVLQAHRGADLDFL